MPAVPDSVSRGRGDSESDTSRFETVEGAHVCVYVLSFCRSSNESGVDSGAIGSSAIVAYVRAFSGLQLLVLALPATVRTF